MRSDCSTCSVAAWAGFAIKADRLPSRGSSVPSACASVRSSWSPPSTRVKWYTTRDHLLEVASRGLS